MRLDTWYKVSTGLKQVVCNNTLYGLEDADVKKYYPLRAIWRAYGDSLPMEFV